MSTRRLQFEFAALQKDPIPGFTVELEDDSVVQWRVIMTGKEGTPYAGGKFLISMDCSDSYPFKAPKVLFKTRIYHPNVDYESGEVCLSLTREGSWKPTIKVADLIEDIAHLIDNPNLDTPLIESAAKLYTSNRQEYDANAKEWTKLYAQTY